MSKSTICLLALCLSAALGSPAADKQQRIIGGSVTNISQYPYIAAVLVVIGNAYMQSCGGTIINNRSILTAAHCFSRPSASQYGIRVGSSFASSGGSVHQVSTIIGHPNYNEATIDNDIGILRVSTAFSFGTNVQVGVIAGENYVVADNQNVWAAGWGLTSNFGSPSEELRHVQLLSVNQNVCQSAYGSFPITQNMLCAGQQGRGICSRDSGGPLAHNNVIVGVVSFDIQCAETSAPAVFARVSRYTSWIQANA